MVTSKKSIYGRELKSNLASKVSKPKNALPISHHNGFYFLVWEVLEAVYDSPSAKKDRDSHL
jgi:hypothetical protein